MSAEGSFATFPSQLAFFRYTPDTPRRAPEIGSEVPGPDSALHNEMSITSSL
jgi:hypothetical protein